MKGKEEKNTDYSLLFHKSSGAELVMNLIMCKMELLMFSDCFSPRSPVSTPVILKSIKSVVMSAERLENEQQRQQRCLLSPACGRARK